MKKILNFLVVFSLVFFYSCDQNADFDTDDDLTGTALAGGAMVDVRADSEGKLLGVPSSLDFETATVAIAESVLNLEIFLLSGGTDVTSYEITKSLNGGNEVTVATSATLPISINYTATEDFLNGLGITADALRIGDVMTFKTKMIHSDGRVSYSGPNDGTYSITISCSSALAASYNLTMVASNGWNINFPNEVVSEKGVGVYKTESIYRWAVGSIAPDQGYDFQDVCGEITVPEQGLAQGYYSNTVMGTEPGQVDGVTGNLKIYYSVDFSSGAVTCVGTYIKL
ncbi:MAG: hypothetical protein ACI8RP_000191 [Urechidicola sp.]|jgi:hypothetical protein